MNLVVSAIGADYDADWVADLLDGFLIDQCIVIFTSEELLNTSRLGKTFATYKFLYDDCRAAQYDFLEEFDIPPVDDAILKAMEPFGDIWFWMSERDKGSFQNRWRDYCKHIRVWNYLLDHLNIDVFISLDEPHEIYDYIIYALCKIKKIKFCCAIYSRLLGYSYMVDDIMNQLPRMNAEIEELQEQYKDATWERIKLGDEIDRFFKSYYEAEDITPWYMTQFRETWYSKVINRLKSFMGRDDKLQRLRNVSAYKRRMQFLFDLELLAILKIIFQRGYLILWSVLHLFSFNIETYRIANQMAYRKNAFREYEILYKFYKDNAVPVDYNNKYIYVALQMQPEATSSPLAGRYVDQILMIQMLAYCLPEGYELYVKEHPAQLARERHDYIFRDVHFYQDIIKIPHVHLVPWEEDTYKLIKGSCAVASMTGTAGFEAVIYNKLFLMFGFFLTQYAPNVFPIRTLEDCYQAMQQVQQYKESKGELKKSVKIYFKALEKFIFKGLCRSNDTYQKLLPPSYWEESKRNLICAYKKKIVEFMGPSVIRNITS